MYISFSDEKDPFNRKPLAIQDLVPATDLKEKINKWLIENGCKPDDN